MASGSLTKQSVITGASHITTMVCLFLTSIIISRTFGTEGRGVYANALALSGFLSLLLSTGHGVANAYFVASGKQKPFEAAGSSVTGLVISTFALTVFTVYALYFRPSFVSLLSNAIIFCAISVVPVGWVAFYLSGILRGIGHADKAYWYYGVGSIINLLGIVIFCIFPSYRKIEFVFIAALVGMVFAIFWLSWFLRKHLSFTWLVPRWKAFKQSMVYSIRFYFGRIANPMQVRIEMLVIPMVFADKSSLGVYAQGIAVLTQVILLSSIIGYVLMPRVAKDGINDESTKMTTMICRLVLFSTAVLGLTLMSVAKYLIPFIFGRGFVASVPLMWIMMPGLVMRSVSRILYHYFQGIGRPIIISFVFFWSIVVMLGLDVVLIPLIGIKGAAIGILCACAVEFFAFGAFFMKATKNSFTQISIIRREDIQILTRRFLRR